MTKFFIQQSDPEAPTVLNDRGPFIPFGWVGVDGDQWNNALYVRDQWKKLRDKGINERPLCLFAVMGWAINIPGNASYTEWDQIIRLWNGKSVDIGAPLMILRKFMDAVKEGYPDWPQ
jgi:hypothetical protein